MLYNKARIDWTARLSICAVAMPVGFMSTGCANSVQTPVTQDVGIEKLEDAAPIEERRVNNIIEFSGYKWKIKESNVPIGPGPNLFSAGAENVWVDEQGRLHLKITRSNGEWVCSELGCETPLGYGTYVFYMASQVDKIDPNAVAGLFIWDDNTYQSQANCEIDIEFARWMSEKAPNLHYSVQPVRGPDEGGLYRERFSAANMELTGLFSTHVFTWTPQSITFASFDGRGNPTPNAIKTWTFDANNPPRRAGSGENVSDPVAVPQPGPDTRLRMNLWLVSGKAPRYNQDVEIIVERFEYFPVKR